MPSKATSRPVMAIIGSASSTLEVHVTRSAEELGRRAVDAGFRVVTGGLGGVMLAASRGARASGKWREGDVLGVLPSYDRSRANEFVDIAIPTGLQYARNVIVVAMADVVVAVHGGAGTLSELALAWQLGRPIVSVGPSGGWAGRLAGQRVDDRSDQAIENAADPGQAVRWALAALERASSPSGDIGSGSRGAP